MKSRRFMGLTVAAVAMTFCVVPVCDTAAQAQQRYQQPQSPSQPDQIEPSGWAMIAYDYDQDRQMEAYEYIFSYDLGEARRMSRQRPEGQERTQRRSAYGDRPPQQQQMQPGRRQPSMDQGRADMRQPPGGFAQEQQQQGRPVQINGRIRDLTMARLAGQQQQHVFAKVETPQGRVVVVGLGPTDQVARLHVYEGDMVQVRGTPARINQRQVIMAREVMANNQRITVQRIRESRTMRLEGRILQTETDRLEGPKQPVHVIGLIRLEDGRRVPVDLGRQEDLENQGVQIRAGQDIVLLARSLSIGKRRILAAERISIDGRQIEVDWLRARQAGQRRQAQVQ